MTSNYSKKLKIHRILSILILAIGVMVLIYGIIVEDEPTLVALLLIVSGTVWYIITRSKIKSLNG